MFKLFPVPIFAPVISSESESQTRQKIFDHNIVSTNFSTMPIVEGNPTLRREYGQLAFQTLQTEFAIYEALLIPINFSFPA